MLSLFRAEHSTARFHPYSGSTIEKALSIHVHVYLVDWLFRQQEREVLVRLMPQILDFVQDWAGR